MYTIHRDASNKVERYSVVNTSHHLSITWLSTYLMCSYQIDAYKVHRYKIFCFEVCRYGEEGSVDVERSEEVAPSVHEEALIPTHKIYVSCRRPPHTRHTQQSPNALSLWNPCIPSEPCVCAFVTLDSRILCVGIK